MANYDNQFFQSSMSNLQGSDGDFIKGDSPQSKIIPKTITENGTYDASDDNADGYSKVTVDVAGGGFNFITTPIATLDTNKTMYFYNLRLYTSESGVYDLSGGDSMDLYDHFYVLINPLVSISELSAIPGGAIIAFTPDDNFDLGSGVELSGDTITNGDGLGYVIRFWRTGTLTGTVYKIVDNHSQQIVWDDNVIIR